MYAEHELVLHGVDDDLDVAPVQLVWSIDSEYCSRAASSDPIRVRGP